MKKLIIALLISAVALASLACGSAEPKASAEDATATAATATEPSAARATPKPADDPLWKTTWNFPDTDPPEVVTWEYRPSEWAAKLLTTTEELGADCSVALEQGSYVEILHSKVETGNGQEVSIHVQPDGDDSRVELILEWLRYYCNHPGEFTRMDVEPIRAAKPVTKSDAANQKAPTPWPTATVWARPTPTMSRLELLRQQEAKNDAQEAERDAWYYGLNDLERMDVDNRCKPTNPFTRDEIKWFAKGRREGTISEAEYSEMMAAMQAGIMASNDKNLEALRKTYPDAPAWVLKGPSASWFCPG